MATGYFITGTDTSVGKTLVSCALLHAFAARGKTVAGMKPVAAGCENGKWMDVEFLVTASNVAAPREWINPYALISPVAPQIAAKRMGIEIDPAVILRACHALQNVAEIVIVEGIGGFLVPLNSQFDTGDMALALGFPVILVVGMRLGCLNHALLTARAVRATGLPLAGWVANQIDPHMMELEGNVHALQQRLDCPLLGVLPFTQGITALRLSAFLDVANLELVKTSTKSC